ncbi:DEAD/DEAH box helicase [Sorangium sp. So ce448]|uniref:DEAD/DEAH box helicase n=1 Tax=Sorangium sp. So ce448 TaxID=3133314 RepID=UPI003F5F01F6
MASAYDLLHEGVRRRLWEMGWTALRPIQDRAIEHLLADRGDCVIAAPTAGGKTEAAFLPILSRIADDAAGGVRAMYIGPLKALINDQFVRLADLCARLAIPVHRWHGDVGAAQRRALLARPSGVLLITPESLEAMFVLRPTQMPSIFGRLAYVVIDEMHAFIGSVRGAQLKSQLYRLRERCGCDPVRVGLSATLGDPEAACAWLRPGGAAATYITDPDAERSLKILVRGYQRQTPGGGADEGAAREEGAARDDDPTLRLVARSILRACHGSTSLAFANAKSRIEELADCLQSEATQMGLRHEVVVHHGSLSKEQREHAEERLRAETPCTAVCSNTLEMGIDIGEVDSVIQVAAPWSVASLAQRVGRSGRREGAAAVLRAFFVEDAPTPEDTLWDGLHLDFLRGIAVIELMLEKFSEPPEVHRPHLSTLVHQLLSTLAETGGMSAQRLYRRLIDSRAFGQLTPGDFAVLLRGLAEHGLVAQMAEGDIILGLRGQKLCDHFSFYAAFTTPEEFRVVHLAREIGSLPATLLPPPGEFVLLAGRRWRVEAIDGDRREVHVIPGKGRRIPKFTSLAADIHPRVHAKMRELACTSDAPTYLDDGAKEILAHVRGTAHLVGRFQPALQPVPPAGRSRVFLWAGTRIQRTVFLALREAGLEVQDEQVGLEVKAPVEQTREVLRGLQERTPDPRLLAARADRELAARQCGADKFDWALPDPLWAAAYAEDRLAISRGAFGVG